MVPLRAILATLMPGSRISENLLRWLRCARKLDVPFQRDIQMLADHRDFCDSARGVPRRRRLGKKAHSHRNERYEMTGFL